MDMFDPEDEVDVWLEDSRGRDIMAASFKSSDCIYDKTRSAMIVDLEGVTFRYDNDYSEEEIAEVKRMKPEQMTIIRAYKKDIHYAV